MNNYTTYHLHTELSLLDSCTNFKAYIDKAVELGQKAICFSEHGNIFNFIEKKMYCKEKGIKYIHGVEIYLTKTLDEKVRDNYHTILIAKNYEGFKELNSLINLSTRPDHFYHKPRISFEEFLAISDNIISTSACLASPLNKLSDDDEYLEKLLKKYNYYEIQPHITSIDQKVFNKRLYDWSIKYNKPLIAGTDTHSLNEYKAECRSILQKAKNIIYEAEDEFDLTYKSYEQLVGMFAEQNKPNLFGKDISIPQSAYMQAIENTNIMADSVEDFDLDTSFKYPKLYEDEETVFNERIEELYNNKLKAGIISDSKIYLDNIEEEKRVFKKIGMTGFMLFMSELMIWCRENNIPFGNCRGSVGGSTIAYILDIIDLDPVVWKTVFSRFANEDRIEIGDIDIDISPSQRELVYNHIIESFGEDYTAYILTTGTISDKGTIDEIGRAFHYDWKKKNPSADEKKSPYHSQRMMEIKSEFDTNEEKTRKKYSDIFYYFDGLVNTVISQGVHPAGIIVSPITLSDNYGSFWNDGKHIMSVNMEEVHEVSLVKYDILGLKNIEIIKDTCDLIGIKYPLSHEVDWYDEEVWKDIASCNIGIFQFESKYAGMMLNKFKPKKINDLSLINAALRPSGTSYRDRLLNGEKNNNPSEQIDELLKDNNGFLVYQEDTIKFLKDICGLSGSDADNVRRAIGRKQKDRLEKALPSILEGYCEKSDKPRDIAEQEAKEFIQIIEDSSDYQFGYNHSTGYSMIGYLCGYFRYHYPLEFITAYLNNAQNQDDLNDGTELARIKGIKIYPFKFGYSRNKYYPDKETNSIYKGISSIKGFGEKVDVSAEMLKLKDNFYLCFVDLLVDIAEQTNIGNSKIKDLITLNYFSQYGRNGKLLSVFNEFASGKNKYTKKLTAKSKEKRIVELYEVERTAEDISLPIKEQIDIEKDLLGVPITTYNLPKSTVYVLELEMKNSPKAKIYSLVTGNISEVKMQKKLYKKNPFEEKDIVQFKGLNRKNKVKFCGYNDNDEPKFEKIADEYDIWATEVVKLSL